MATDITLQHDTLPAPDAKDLKFEVASQWQLMWWRFRKHRLALVSTFIIAFFYILVLFCEFIAPSTPMTYKKDYAGAPPQSLHLFRDGRLDPFVFGYKYERDPLTLKKTWVVDPEMVIPVGFFVKGDPYKMWELFPGDLHLFGSKHPDDPFYLLGADRNGRDMLSRIIYSARVSLTIGLVGVFISFTLGILIGGMSGLMGGRVDNFVQRLIEVEMAVPTFPLLLALAAVVPLSWSPLLVYFIISIIIALRGWSGLARVVRSKFLSLREEDFIMAAEFDGCSRVRTVTRHMIPSFASHIIASITLAIPGMILSETALSFLGVGLRPPVVSWGVMLQDCQNVTSIAIYPWLMYPGLAVFIVVLAFNFFGDGLRDAADPYQH